MLLEPKSPPGTPTAALERALLYGADHDDPESMLMVELEKAFATRVRSLQRFVDHALSGIEARSEKLIYGQDDPEATRPRLRCKRRKFGSHSIRDSPYSSAVQAGDRVSDTPSSTCSRHRSAPSTVIPSTCRVSESR